MKSIHDQVAILVETLSTIKTTLLTMLELEDQKYETIKDMDFNLLADLNDREEALVSKINLLEVQRQDILDNLSVMVGFDPSLSVTEISHKLPLDTQSSVRSVCLEIRRVCDRISIATERNNYILSNNSEIFNQILNLAQGTDYANDQYTIMGTAQEAQASQLFVLDQIV